MLRALNIGCLIVIAVSKSWAYAPGQDEKAQQHYQAGQRAQEAGSYAVAVQEYLKVIAIMPDAAEGYASLGLAYNAENKFDDSAQALEKAEKLKPGLKGVSLYLGIDLVKLNRAAEAIRYLREATRLEPNNKEAWIWLSAAMLESGRTAEGIDSLSEANAHFPSDPDILFQLGEAYRGAAEAGIAHILTSAAGQPLVHQIYGDIYRDKEIWTKAAGHYGRALAEDSHWAGAHLGLGEIALRQDKLDEAEREFRLELQINPQAASAVAQLAEIALLKGDAQHAAALLRQAVAIDPSQASFALGLPPETAPDAPIREASGKQLRDCIPGLVDASVNPSRSLALAFVNWRIGNSDAYSSNWKKFQEQTTHTTHTNQYQAALDNFHRGNLTLAVSELRTWLKTRPGDLQASYLLARTYQHISLSLLGRLLADLPESYSAHMLLAETYENSESYDKAIAEYRKAEQMAPDLPGIHYSLGHLLAKIGNREQAMAELNAALRLNPNDARANAELGSILVALGDQSKGIACLKKALFIEPDLWEAHRDLGEAYYNQKDFTTAAAELQKAINHDPDGSAHYQLGLVYRALGRSVDARRMLAQAQRMKAAWLSDTDVARSLPEPSKP